jgi:hypothetical protein
LHLGLLGFAVAIFFDPVERPNRITESFPSNGITKSRLNLFFASNPVRLSVYMIRLPSRFARA